MKYRTIVHNAKGCTASLHHFEIKLSKEHIAVCRIQYTRPDPDPDPELERDWILGIQIRILYPIVENLL